MTWILTLMYLKMVKELILTVLQQGHWMTLWSYLKLKEFRDVGGNAEHWDEHYPSWQPDPEKQSSYFQLIRVTLNCHNPIVQYFPSMDSPLHIQMWFFLCLIRLKPNKIGTEVLILILMQNSWFKNSLRALWNSWVIQYPHPQILNSKLWTGRSIFKKVWFSFQELRKTNRFLNSIMLCHLFIFCSQR